MKVSLSDIYQKWVRYVFLLEGVLFSLLSVSQSPLHCSCGVVFLTYWVRSAGKLRISSVAVRKVECEENSSTGVSEVELNAGE